MACDTIIASKPTISQRKKPPMRTTIQKQTKIVEKKIDHEHAEELHQIRKLIEASPEIPNLIYADLVRGLKNPDQGRAGKMTAEQVFMVLMIKQINDFSYETLRFHLADSRSYSSFCGFGICDPIPSKSILQRDIKKIQPQTMERINRIILGVASDLGIEKGRKVRVDCTVTESNIHPPTDSSLLFDCVRVLCRLCLQAKQEFGFIVSDHTRRAKKRALGILNAKNDKARKKHYRDLLQVTGKATANAERILTQLKAARVADPLLIEGLSVELERYLPLAKRVMDQTERRVVKGEKLGPEEKLVSIFEPHADIIVKDRRDTYYGHKLALTGGASGLITDLVICEGNPADSQMATKMIERQREVYGRVPRQAAFDGGFASKANLAEIKELGVKDVAFSKRRGLEISDMAKSTWVYRKLRDFRAGIEGMISFLKRCLGLGRCNWSGFESFKAYAWSSVVAANLLLLARHQL